MKRLSHSFKQLGVILAAVCGCLPVSAQTEEDESLGQVISNYTVDQNVFGGGNFYYQIMLEPSGETVARGRMDVDGIDRIILAPQTAYRLVSFYAETLSFGYVTFSTPPSGRTFVIPTITYLEIPGMDDSDGDGLPDVHETIAGTSIVNPDTDGDGFLDGAEVINGQNPLDGFIVDIGIIASGPTPSPAIDIVAVNNLAVVAMGQGGVAVFNVRNGFEPVRIAQVDTPGEARAVSVYGNLIAVADHTGGLAIIDISDPAGARIIRQVPLNRPSLCVATRGNFAFVGLDNGHVVMVDLLTGTEAARYEGITGAIQDLGVKENFLYVLKVGTLHTLRINDSDLQQVGSVSAPGSTGAGGFRWRLFVGDDFLYATNTFGYNIFDLPQPSTPVHLRQVTTPQVGWKQFVATGTGLAVGTVSPNSTRDGPHHVDLYSVGDDNRSTTFQRTIETPGIATALSIYNALAYVADDAGGLQVINYASFDAAGIPPELMVRHSGINGQVEEGKILSVVVDVTDDVQVRNVQFFVDGQPSAIDGNFPFEVGLQIPLITVDKRTFSFHVVASDTGGNTTRSETVTLQLVPDATAPYVRRFLPRGGSVLGSLQSLLLVFSEPMQPSTFVLGAVTLHTAGADKTLGSPDDQVIPLQGTTYQAATNSLQVALPALLPNLYRIRVAPPISDLAGNPLASAQESTFRIYGFTDDDADGVPDDLEPLLGLDPTKSDTDGDGILDGDEDRDNDGLSNTGEIIMKTDPLNPDSDFDNINDGFEDTDFDGLRDGLEIVNGADPFKVDSDGDGIDDLAEVLDGLDPADPTSAYPQVVTSASTSFLNAISSPVDLSLPFMVASPSVSFLNAGLSEVDSTLSFMVASPSVSFLNAMLSSADLAGTLLLASPEVSYLNGLLDEVPTDQTLFFVSPIVSYENQP